MSEVLDVRCPCGGELLSVAASRQEAGTVVAVCIDCGEPVLVRNEERIGLGVVGFPAGLAVSLREQIQVTLETARKERAIFGE